MSESFVQGSGSSFRIIGTEISVKSKIELPKGAFVYQAPAVSVDTDKVVRGLLRYNKYIFSVWAYRSSPTSLYLSVFTDSFKFISSVKVTDDAYNGENSSNNLYNFRYIESDGIVVVTTPNSAHTAHLIALITFDGYSLKVVNVFSGQLTDYYSASARGVCGIVQLPGYLYIIYRSSNESGNYYDMWAAIFSYNKSSGLSLIKCVDTGITSRYLQDSVDVGDGYVFGLGSTVGSSTPDRGTSRLRFSGNSVAFHTQNSSLIDGTGMPPQVCARNMIVLKSDATSAVVAVLDASNYLLQITKNGTGMGITVNRYSGVRDNSACGWFDGTYVWIGSSYEYNGSVYTLHKSLYNGTSLGYPEQVFSVSSEYPRINDAGFVVPCGSSPDAVICCDFQYYESSSYEKGYILVESSGVSSRPAKSGELCSGVCVGASNGTYDVIVP